MQASKRRSTIINSKFVSDNFGSIYGEPARRAFAHVPKPVCAHWLADNRLLIKVVQQQIEPKSSISSIFGARTSVCLRTFERPTKAVARTVKSHRSTEQQSILTSATTKVTRVRPKCAESTHFISHSYIICGRQPVMHTCEYILIYLFANTSRSIL